VKVPSRKAVSAAAQRRNDLQADRAKSATVRELFPQVGVIHVDLDFGDKSGRPPSPQRHSLYPPARAFFRFICPCADCDGDFDLAAAVTELVKAGAPVKRAAGRSVTGRSLCQGTHWRDSTHSESCRIELTFRVVVSFGSTVEQPAESAA
jgi:hypothetical protein